MKRPRSSPADLERQLLVVDLRALEAARDRVIADVRAAVDLRALEAARDRLIADVRSRWLARAAAALRTRALCATAYGASFTSAVSSR